MEYSCIGLNDLPDEILIIIFKKLNNLDVLYSLQGVNQRLNHIIYDPIFTSRLTFVKRLLHNFIDVFHCNMVLNRFCLQILPEIHDKIKWLDLESSSMKYILHAAHYPNLHTLGLYNINQESAQCLFTDEILSSGIFKDQITTLILTIDNNNNDDYEEMLLSATNIFDYIFTVFTNLIHLIFYESSFKNRVPLYFADPPSHTFRSSTLLRLNVRLESFNDCLYLLDGRFNQLHTLYVDLTHIQRSNKIQNQGDLSNLKYFHLSCNQETFDYYKVILPLLYRMSNLEKLRLYLVIFFNDTFIDGNHLKKNIIYRVPNLNQFIFYIRSLIYTGNKLNLPSTEDIQRIFMDFQYSEIISYVDYFPETKYGRCHIYSYPFLMPYYVDITNNFPGGLYNYVCVVSLRDEYPFEHDFFLRIVQSFPCIEDLTVTNNKPQNRKQSYESNNVNCYSSIIKYSFLNELDLLDVHDDYIEEFLFDTKIYFQDVFLRIKCESLQRITQNFTRDATRINCTKINELELSGEPLCSDSLQQYFPHARINYDLLGAYDEPVAGPPILNEPVAGPPTSDEPVADPPTSDEPMAGPPSSLRIYNEKKKRYCNKRYFCYCCLEYDCNDEL
ncbi:unnamed protein product [Rotaria sordida]|uniref:F-box domain-containing protein n=1 Tax=Rotaria sordida TaxID=392033 RepID=A0A814I998_9BILA|nr:unnamed protein product [Rotaria sordida]CAF1131198.1 unnamed protein product [Rotaria sordida]